MPIRKKISEVWTDQQLLQGLWENDTSVLEAIYARYLPLVRQMVRQNNGHDADADDVLQDALVVLFRKADDPDFALTASFGSYLLSVARFVWLRKLRKNNRTSGVTPELESVLTTDDSIEASVIQSEKRQLFQEKLGELGADCQQVLRLFFTGTPLREIARQMGYTDDYIKKKNRRCKQKLADRVKQDSRYHELK